MPTEAQLAEFYRAEYTSTHHQAEGQEANAEYYRQHARELLRLAKKDAGKLRIADIGCSLPVFLREARPVCSEAIGVDYSQEAHRAGAQWNVHMLTPEQFAQDVPDGSLDVLRYSHVLEHLVDPMDVIMKNVKKVVPGGLLYITQPNFPVLKARASITELHDCVWPNHLHFFNPISMVRMAERISVDIFRYITHEKDRETFHKFEYDIDFAYTIDQLEVVRQKGNPAIGPFSVWPFFSGLNMGVFGYRIA